MLLSWQPLPFLFITLMGLIGYINDEMQRRSKEIAIRKVNGAEASSILVLTFQKYILLDFFTCLVIGTVCAGIWEYMDGAVCRSSYVPSGLLYWGGFRGVGTDNWLCHSESLAHCQ